MDLSFSPTFFFGFYVKISVYAMNVCARSTIKNDREIDLVLVDMPVNII